MRPDEASALAFFGAGLENAEIEAELVPIFSRVVTSGDMLNGPEVAVLEARIARAAGRAHAIAVGSASDGLHFALAAAGIGPGDEVLVPAFSFVATAAGILRTGAKPVFVDVLPPDPGGGRAPCTMDLEAAAAKLTRRTRAVIWAGLFGGIGDPALLERFVATHGLALIEDAAQSFGAAFDGRPAGSYGTAAVFSFDRNKPLAAPGTGGAVVTDDPAAAAAIRSLRYHGAGRNCFERLGYNSQLSTLAAGILDCKLGHQQDWRRRRAAVAAHYDAGLAGLPVELPVWSRNVVNVHHKYVLFTEGADDLAARLLAKGVPTRRHYAVPLPKEPVFAAANASERFPVAESLARRALSLPIYAQLPPAHISRILDAVRRCIG